MKLVFTTQNNFTVVFFLFLTFVCSFLNFANANSAGTYQCTDDQFICVGDTVFSVEYNIEIPSKVNRISKIESVGFMVEVGHWFQASLVGKKAVPKKWQDKNRPSCNMDGICLGSFVRYADSMTKTQNFGIVGGFQKDGTIALREYSNPKSVFYNPFSKFLGVFESKDLIGCNVFQFLFDGNFKCDDFDSTYDPAKKKAVEYPKVTQKMVSDELRKTFSYPTNKFSDVWRLDSGDIIKSISFSAAAHYCKTLQLRLPTIRELITEWNSDDYLSTYIPNILVEVTDFEKKNLGRVYALAAALNGEPFLDYKDFENFKFVNPDNEIPFYYTEVYARRELRDDQSPYMLWSSSKKVVDGKEHWYVFDLRTGIVHLSDRFGTHTVARCVIE